MFVTCCSYVDISYNSSSTSIYTPTTPAAEAAANGGATAAVASSSPRPQSFTTQSQHLQQPEQPPPQQAPPPRCHTSIGLAAACSGSDSVRRRRRRLLRPCGLPTAGSRQTLGASSCTDLGRRPDTLVSPRISPLLWLQQCVMPSLVVTSSTKGAFGKTTHLTFKILFNRAENSSAYSRWWF